MKYACEQSLYLGDLDYQTFFMSGEINLNAYGEVKAKVELLQLLLPDGAFVEVSGLLTQKSRADVEAVMAEYYIDEAQEERESLAEWSLGEGV